MTHWQTHVLRYRQECMGASWWREWWTHPLNVIYSHHRNLLYSDRQLSWSLSQWKQCVICKMSNKVHLMYYYFIVVYSNLLSNQTSLSFTRSTIKAINRETTELWIIADISKFIQNPVGKNGKNILYFWQLSVEEMTSVLRVVLIFFPFSTELKRLADVQKINQTLLWYLIYHLGDLSTVLALVQSDDLPNHRPACIKALIGSVISSERKTATSKSITRLMNCWTEFAIKPFNIPLRLMNSDFGDDAGQYWFPGHVFNVIVLLFIAVCIPFQVYWDHAALWFCTLDKTVYKISKNIWCPPLWLKKRGEFEKGLCKFLPMCQNRDQFCSF